MKRGVTLLEVLVVVAIFIVLTSIGVSTMADFKRRQESQSVVVGLTSLLEDARARTVASLGDSAYGVRIASSSAMLFKGSSYSPANVIGNTVVFPPTLVAIVDLNGDGNDVVFDRLTGQTQKYGIVSLSVFGTTTTIRIHETGTIDTD